VFVCKRIFESIYKSVCVCDRQDFRIPDFFILRFLLGMRLWVNLAQFVRSFNLICSSQFEVSRRFRKIYYLHLQRWTGNRAINQCE
jgi:hypothetical protein